MNIANGDRWQGCQWAPICEWHLNPRQMPKKLREIYEGEVRGKNLENGSRQSRLSVSLRQFSNFPFSNCRFLKSAPRAWQWFPDWNHKSRQIWIWGDFSWSPLIVTWKCSLFIHHYHLCIVKVTDDFVVKSDVTTVTLVMWNVPLDCEHPCRSLSLVILLLFIYVNFDDPCWPLELVMKSGDFHKDALMHTIMDCRNFYFITEALMHCNRAYV